MIQTRDSKKLDNGNRTFKTEDENDDKVTHTSDEKPIDSVRDQKEFSKSYSENDVSKNEGSEKNLSKLNTEELDSNVYKKESDSKNYQKTDHFPNFDESPFGQSFEAFHEGKTNDNLFTDNFVNNQELQVENKDNEGTGNVKDNFTTKSNNGRFDDLPFEPYAESSPIKEPSQIQSEAIFQKNEIEIRKEVSDSEIELENEFDDEEVRIEEGKIIKELPLDTLESEVNFDTDKNSPLESRETSTTKEEPQSENNEKNELDDFFSDSFDYQINKELQFFDNNTGMYLNCQVYILSLQVIFLTGQNQFDSSQFISEHISPDPFTDENPFSGNKRKGSCS